MTSNVGSSYLLEGIDSEGNISDGVRGEVLDDLSSYFRPEFLNRVDDIIFFKPLRKEEIGRIVNLMLGELEDRLQERRMSLSISDEAVAYVVDGGFDPVYGARPLRRFIQQHVENLLARELIKGEILDGAEIIVGVADGELKVSWKNPS